MKENCSKNTLEIVGIEIILHFIKIFNLVLFFAMLARGRRVHYENVVAQQPLLVRSVISAVCISVLVVYICDKVVDSKVG